MSIVTATALAATVITVAASHCPGGELFCRRPQRRSLLAEISSAVAPGYLFGCRVHEAPWRSSRPLLRTTNSADAAVFLLTGRPVSAAGCKRRLHDLTLLSFPGRGRNRTPTPSPGCGAALARPRSLPPRPTGRRPQWHRIRF